MTIQTPIQLPASTKYGYVDGRFILSVGDTTGDVDRYPQALPAVGTIRFTPKTTKVIVTPNPVTILPQPVIASLNNQGYLLDQTGARGVWLAVGEYQVSYMLNVPGVTSHPLFVTEDDTPESPNDLSLASMYVPDTPEALIVPPWAQSVVVDIRLVGDELILTRASGQTEVVMTATTTDTSFGLDAFGMEAFGG